MCAICAHAHVSIADYCFCCCCCCCCTHFHVMIVASWLFVGLPFWCTHILRLLLLLFEQSIRYDHCVCHFVPTHKYPIECMFARRTNNDCVYLYRIALLYLGIGISLDFVHKFKTTIYAAMLQMQSNLFFYIFVTAKMWNGDS